MTSPISFDSSEDLFSQYATWLLKEGIWDGVPVTWKDAASLQSHIEKRLTELLFSQHPDSLGFQQLAAQYAWLGADARSRLFLEKKIEELRVLSNGTVLKTRSWASKFWKKHKVEIIVGIAAVGIIGVAAIVTVCSGGTAAGAVVAAGAATLDHLVNGEESSHRPKPPLAKEIPHFDPKPTQFLENGVLLNDEFFTYQELREKARQEDFFSSLQNNLNPPIANSPSHPSQFNDFLDWIKPTPPIPNISESLFENTIPELEIPPPPTLYFNTAKEILDAEALDIPVQTNGRTLFLEQGILMDGQFMTYKEIREKVRTEEILSSLGSSLGKSPAPSTPQTPTPNPCSDRSLLYDFFETIGRGILGPELLDPNFLQFQIETSRHLTTPGTPKKHLCIAGINGMNTSVQQATNHANYLNRFTPDQSISWVYNNSHGAVADLAEIFTLNYLGISPNTGQLLQENWTAFHEENKDNPHAKFLQFCHSQGAIHVRNALAGLPEEIRNRVIVVAIAPGAVVPKSLCYESFNYASKYDIVPHGELAFTSAFDSSETGISKRTEMVLELQNQLILLDPHPDAKGLDHDFQSPTFTDIIEKHIKNYIMNNGEYK